MATVVFLQEDTITSDGPLSAPLASTFLALTWGHNEAAGSIPSFTWNGDALTEDESFQTTANRVAVYHIQLPDIGVFTLASSGWQSGIGHALWFRWIQKTGDPVQDVDGEFSAADDDLTVNLTASKGDLAVVSASYEGGGASWKNVEDGDSYINGSASLGAAYEVPSSANESATFGKTGFDSRCAIAGVSYFQDNATFGSQVVALMSKFYDDLKKGLIPDWDFQRRYKEVFI